MEIAKPGAPESTVSYAEAVEIALCYGWIDGQKKAQDAMYWLQRFTPRRPRSIWSKVNRARAEKLIAAGRMQASGQAEIDRAKADGRWEAAYDSARTASVPPDLQAALDAQPKARAFFLTSDQRLIPVTSRGERIKLSVAPPCGAGERQPPVRTGRCRRRAPGNRW